MVARSAKIAVIMADLGDISPTNDPRIMIAGTIFSTAATYGGLPRGIDDRNFRRGPA